jgi:hypothetical protein
VIRPFAKSLFRNEKDWVLGKSAVSLELFSNSGQQKPIAALFFGCGCSSTPSSRLALGSRRLGLSEIPFGKRSNRRIQRRNQRRGSSRILKINTCTKKIIFRKGFEPCFLWFRFESGGPISDPSRSNGLLFPEKQSKCWLRRVGRQSVRCTGYSPASIFLRMDSTTKGLSLG